MATKKDLAEGLTVAKLTAMAKKAKLAVKSSMKKADLVALVSGSSKIKKADLEKAAK